MIKAENGHVVIKGNTFNVLNDFHDALCAFRKYIEKDLKPENAKEFILHMVEVVYMTKEEIEAENEKDKREYPEISALAEIATILTLAKRGVQDGE